jgi:hypothetical protein
MEILAGPLDWTHIDEENLAHFLDTDTGKRFVPKLVEDAPLLLEKGDINAILIRSGEVRGYQILVRALLGLAHPTPKTEPAAATAYPPLEDDTAWADGQKLEPTTPEKE